MFLPNVMKLRAVEWFQQEAYVHPLTCGNDSSHDKLEGCETAAGTLYLQCPGCNYIQYWVPELVYDMYILEGIGLGKLKI